MLGSRREARRSRRRQGRRAACQEPGARGRRAACQVISHTTE